MRRLLCHNGVVSKPLSYTYKIQKKLYPRLALAGKAWENLRWVDGNNSLLQTATMLWDFKRSVSADETDRGFTRWTGRKEGRPILHSFLGQLHHSSAEQNEMQIYSTEHDNVRSEFSAMPSQNTRSWPGIISILKRLIENVSGINFHRVE